MSESRRCAKCRVRWPMGHTLCPKCGAKTAIMRLVPTADEETAQAALQERFITHYSERESRRIAEGYLAPEYLGKQEAQEVIRLERQFRVGRKSPDTVA